MDNNIPTLVFLSTYPPRECGIATFTQDLLFYIQKFLGSRTQCVVAALNLSPLDTYKYPPEVRWQIDQNSKTEYTTLAKTITNEANIYGVIIQHEYGIFGGIEGEKILSFMQHCKKPMLVTLHTVLPAPSLKMKQVTAKIIHLAHSVVVLTQSSKEIIEQMYPDAVGKVFVIPHGIHPSVFSSPKKFKNKLGFGNHSVVSTFGLLNRGKGIEYAINALPEVIKKHPSLLYLILGETHPVVRRKEGEKYRIELTKLITKLDLKKHVKFYDQYLDLSDLLAFLQATDIYIATSTNPNQAVSGTLSYALGVGRAVISTQFAQAKEIVTADTGRLVPIKDSHALSLALLDLLEDKKKLKQMHRNAYQKTRPMVWNKVAQDYTNLITRAVVPPLNLDHLRRMTDHFGLFQFASFIHPNKEFGYTVDDNARALIVCSLLLKQAYTKEGVDLVRIYLAFIKKCQKEDGSFINYIGFKHKTPTKQNNQEDLEDAQSRALWALGEVMSNPLLPLSLQKEAKELFILAIAQGPHLHHLRAKALAIKAFAQVLGVLPKQKEVLIRSIKEYADSLLGALQKNSLKSWMWFEDHLHYNNALLAESLLIAGARTNNAEYTKQGLLALQFLISKTFSATMYLPIGHSHWYKNKEKRSEYDQQPEDPASMILALATAYTSTHNEEYKNLAKKCFSWFLGNNTLQRPLYNDKTGGCYDGLHPTRVNLNQGAESLVSYLLSSITIRQFQIDEHSKN